MPNDQNFVISATVDGFLQIRNATEGRLLEK